jgi:uncharacterized membrane protein YbhN (UPF0104 family)
MKHLHLVVNNYVLNALFLSNILGKINPTGSGSAPIFYWGLKQRAGLSGDSSTILAFQKFNHLKQV